MGRQARAWQTSAALVAGSLLSSGRAGAQQAVGHAVNGTLGLQAGSQADTGVYAINRVEMYPSNELIGPRGNGLPVDVDLRIYSNVVGIAGTYEVPALATFLSASVSAPISRVTSSSESPQASVDLFGLGDFYVQPVQLGWRVPHLDLTTGYAFTAPTAPHEPGGTDGVGSAQWTHEVMLGAALYFDEDRNWSLSGLSTYTVNEHKVDADITRGQSVQVQGGFGAKVRPYLDVGLAGYGFWQVTLDSGAALPPVLRGLRDTAYGAGPEIDVTIAPLRSRVAMRYEHDLAVRARPEGQIFVIEVVVAAWKRNPH